MVTERWMRGVATAYERDASIAEVFHSIAAAQPEAVATNDGSRSLTYCELDLYSNRLANHLRALGVVEGSRVGVAIDRTTDVVVALLGVLKAGSAYVPLDPSNPRNRTSFVISDVGIDTLIVTKRSEVSEVAISRVVALGEDASAIEACSPTQPLSRVGSTDLAYVMYTSGSTGRPKGVEITHRGVLRLVRGTDYVSIGPRDVFFQFAPLAFDASTFEIWGALLNGATLAFAPPGATSLADVGRSLQRFGVTILWLTAPLFSLMVRTELASFGSLRYLLTGGDVVSARDAATFVAAHPRCRLVDGYGPTENTTFSCCYEVGSLASLGETVPIGKPIANSSAYILDERFEPVAPGEVGELFVGGDGVARGYVNLPELTAERFVTDPFDPETGARMYRTGDLARLRPDGAIEFLGRRDHQVKIRGYRIELGEIEYALRELPEVLEAAVLVSRGASEDKSLSAVVVVASERTFDSNAIRMRLEAKLPSYMIPHRISVMRDLPKTSSGKLDRNLLEALVERMTDVRPRIELQPKRVLESAIAAVWVDTLGPGADADFDVNFFDAGGDSLRLLALHDRLVRKLGIPIELLDLFSHVTIRSLAAALRERQSFETPK